MPQIYQMQTRAVGAAKLREWIRDEFETTPEQIETLSEMLDNLVAECLGVETPDPFDKGLNTKGVPAMDSATRSALRIMNAIRTAEADVKSVIGEAPLQTSVAATYKLALARMNVDLAGVDPSAYGAMFRLARQTQNGGRPLAMDAKGDADLRTRFPSLARIRQG